MTDKEWCIDEVDGMMTLPPEDEEKLIEQVEYMRCRLNRPKIVDREITIPLLKWQWAWLHMRYHKIDKSANGLRIKNWHISREKLYRKEYQDGLGDSGEKE